MAVRRSLIVSLESTEGVCGYGESAPFELPFYSGETVASATACLVDVLLPRLVGRALSRPEEVREVLSDGVRGNRMARAGAETAWWDLRARTRGIKLPELVSERLGELNAPDGSFARSDRIPCGVALGIPADESLEVLVREVEDALAAGYRRIKLKVRPGWDEEPIRAVREVLGRWRSPVPIWVDANGSYRFDEHLDALRRIDDLGLLFVEQPFPEEALWDAATWNRSAATPVCLDETLVSDDVARQVLDMQGPTIWNLKVQRLGGLEETCRVYARGATAGAELWVGTMPETGIGAQCALAVACQRGCVHSTDVEPSERWYQPGTDLCEMEMDSEGFMQAPDIYVNPPMDRLRILREIP